MDAALPPDTGIEPLDLPSLCLAITQHAPLPMATVEGATRIVRYANPAFCRLMGKPLEALVGNPFDELLPEKDQCVTLIERVFRTRTPASYTEQEPTKPHPVFWSYTIWPVMEEQGLVGVMIQVTETAKVHGDTVAMNEALLLGSIRQHELIEAADTLNAQLGQEIIARENIASELLEKARQLSQKAQELAEKARLLDLTEDAIIVRNVDGRITYWNHGAELLYGWTSEEALGKFSHALVQTEFPFPLTEEQLAAELHRHGR
jgi:PAS domain S-box-containing protein